jgi:hypothetical protein
VLVVKPSQADESDGGRVEVSNAGISAGIGGIHCKECCDVFKTSRYGKVEYKDIWETE